MTVSPTGAPPGFYYDATIKAYVECPAGTFSPGGQTAPTADPGGTFSAAGASAPIEDPAGTYSSPAALNRVFVQWQNNTPDNVALAFHNETEVANYYGVSSVEAAQARTFFGTDQSYAGAGATFYTVRLGHKQRPHLLGANIAAAGLAGLQAINGTLDITFNGRNYSGQVNLAGVPDFITAANDIRLALDANLPIAARTTNSTIAPVSLGFTGSVSKAFLTVTNAAPGTIKIGAEISGAGVVTTGGAPAQIIEQINGTPGGDGEYALFTASGTTRTEPLTENYGVLTVGTQTSGAVAAGERVNSPDANVATDTAIIDNLSGTTGSGSKWLVNNAQTVGPENLTMRATPLQVILDWDNIPIVGKTEDNLFFDITTGGLYGWDNAPSSIGFASSPPGGQDVATLLGLTQATGAIDTSPGGQGLDVHDFMNELVDGKIRDRFGNPVTFGSFQSSIPRVATMMEQWDASHAGGRDAYVFSTDTTTTTPAGQSTPVTDPPGTTSGAGASAPTLGAAIDPTITGTVANQPDTVGAPIALFSTVVVGDTNVGATDQLKISPVGAGGAMKGTGLTESGGVYMIAGSAAEITTDLHTVLFTPALAGTTQFTLADFSDFGTKTTDGLTSVVATTPPLGADLLSAPLASASALVHDSEPFGTRGWSVTATETVGHGPGPGSF